MIPFKMTFMARSMAEVLDILKKFFSIVIFCCVCGSEARTKFESLLSEDDLRHYVRGNHEVEEFDIIDPFAFDGRSKRSSLSETILSTSRLQVSAFDEDFHLELIENPWLVSSDLEIEHVYGTKIQVERHNGKRCHFHGRSKNHNDSVAVISTCTGIHGLITFGDNEVYIEPLKKDHTSKLVSHVTNDFKQPHIVYKRRLKEETNNVFCGVKEDSSRGKERKRKYTEDVDFEFYVGPKYIEIKLVLDVDFVREHSPDASEYAMALMNIASRRFVDSSLGFPIHLYIVSIQQFHDHEPFNVTSGLLDTFYSFRSWLAETSINNDDNPHHWDHAILLSSNMYDRENNTAIGYGSVLPPMCFPHPNLASCNAVIDLGLGTGFVIVHEIGHSLGLRHDDEAEVNCGTNFIMASQLNEEQSAFTWSSCSRKTLNKIWRGKPGCLDDIRNDDVREVSISDVSLDQHSLQQQCREYVDKLNPQNEESDIFGCENQTTCTSLVCRWHGGKCWARGLPPVEGTRCGSYNYCINGECISDVGIIPSLGASDGKFSEWETSPCSRSCGGGIKVTRRICTNPRQAFAGAFCDGQHVHYELCNMQPCGGGRTFLDERNDSCSEIAPELSFWIFLGNQGPPTCLKACVNNTSFKWKYFEPVFFEDGTKCWDDIMQGDFTKENRCVAGKCVQFNCYGDEGNEGLYDVCRICGGRGTSCSFYNESVFNDDEQRRDIVLPMSATSVLVTNYDCETKEGLTALDVHQGESVFVDQGNVFRVGFDVQDGDKCAVNLTSTGPLMEDFPLTLKNRSQTGTNKKLLSVSYYLPKTSPTFLWRPGPFSLCSVDCGKGTRTRTVKCIEVVNGNERHVADHLCPTLEKPVITLPCSIPCWSFIYSQCKIDEKSHVNTTVRSADCKVGDETVDAWQCNQATRPVNIQMSCSGYQWTLGPWSKCYNSTRTRSVTCVIQPFKSVVPEEMCNSDEKPLSFERCPPMSPEIIIWTFAILVFLLGLGGLFVWRCLRKRQEVQLSRLRDHDIAEASVNLRQVFTVSRRATRTFPSFRDTNGIIHDIRIADLPNCLQKVNFNPEETLVDELKKLRPLHEPGLTVTPLPPTYGDQGSTDSQQNATSSANGHPTPRYIKDQEGKVAFIVTGGPYSSSAESFWTLTWQEKVPIIVNLTQVKGDTTAHSPLSISNQSGYWCGEFNFTHVRTNERPGYSLKELTVVKGCESRQVTICHFLLWPKNGIPAQPEAVIGFIKKLKSLYKGYSTPILIYCNNDPRVPVAFISIVSLVEFLKTKQRVNVQEFVRNLTLNHGHTVPNQSQYNFIYEALAAASLFGMVDIQPLDVLNIAPRSYKHPSRIIAEFKALSHQPNFATPANSVEGSKPNNATKNRYPNIVPLDIYRPAWRCTDNTDVMNYINATLVDSFWREDGIILAQSPLPSTIGDFWNMVYIYRCAAIVSLNKFTNRNENVPAYWLPGTTSKYGKITVQCLQEQLVKRGVFAKRKMCILHQNNNIPLNVDHYQLFDWPTSNKNLSGLIDIITIIQPLLKARKRIVLHCLDGANRCGVVAAVSTELGRVKEDGVVDLFQTVFKLRRRNPNAIKSQEDYNDCYTILQAALREWRVEF